MATRGYIRPVVYGVRSNLSAWSKPVAARLPLRSIAPGAPTGVAASGTVEAVVVSWTAPVVRTDGEDLPFGAIAGYRVFVSDAASIDVGDPGTYDSVWFVNAESFVYSLDGSYMGPWYFVVCAVDRAGNLGTPSTEVDDSGLISPDGTDIDDWSTGNAETVIVGAGRIFVKMRAAKTTWTGFAYYKVYVDVDTGGGFPASWAAIGTTATGFMHAPLTTTYAYQYKVTVVGRDGTETDGTTHNGEGSGYTPDEDDQDNLLADTVAAQHIIAQYDIKGRTLIGGTLRSTNWGAGAGTEFDLEAGTFKMGGSSAPKFSWDGSELVTAGTHKSENYVEGEDGWAIFKTGNAEFYNVYIRGGTIELDSMPSLGTVHENVVSNFSFEKTSAGAPANWTVSANWAVEEGDAFHGGKSMRCTADGTLYSTWGQCNPGLDVKGGLAVKSDVSPTTPAMTGVATGTGTGTHVVCVSSADGLFVGVGGDSPKVVSFDMRDPSAPVVRSSLALDASPRHIWISGSTLGVIAGESLYIYTVELNQGITLDDTVANQSEDVWEPTMIAGGVHSLGIRSDAKLYTWGYNTKGQLGDGTTTQRESPTAIGSCPWNRVAGGTQAAAGYSLGIRADDKLYAWGYNEYGQLGDGSTTDRLSPTAIGSSTWKAIAAGNYHSLGILGDDKLFAWGLNGNGQLGDGSTTQRTAPTAVGSCTWKAIAAGGWFSLGIRADDKLYAWGLNTYGQLGDGSTTQRISPTVIGSSTWKAIAAGTNHSLGILSDDKLFAWGRNQYGELGDGTTTQRVSPTAIGSCTWKAIAAGVSHSLGIRGDDALYAWGRNAYGDLGDGSNTQRESPTAIGSCTWKAIAAGEAYSLGIRADSTAYGWGYNTFGCVGDGTTTHRTAPVGVSLDVKIVAFGPHTAIRHADYVYHCVYVADLLSRSDGDYIEADSLHLTGASPPFVLSRSGNTLFVAARGSAHLFAVDISDPVSLSILDTATPAAAATDIVVYGNYLYLQTASDVKVYNVTDPSDITFVKAFGDAANGTYGLALYGKYLYTCGPDTTNRVIKAYSLANPADPAYAGTSGNQANDMAFPGGYGGKLYLPGYTGAALAPKGYAATLANADIRLYAQFGTAAVIGAAVHTGTGLDDMTSGGNYTGLGSSAISYRVEIDSEGTPDTFRWSNDGGATWEVEGVNIMGTPQHLEDGVRVTFDADTGHDDEDRWDFTVTPSQVLDTVQLYRGNRDGPLAVDSWQGVVKVLAAGALSGSIQAMRAKVESNLAGADEVWVDTVSLRNEA